MGITVISQNSPLEETKDAAGFAPVKKGETLQEFLQKILPENIMKELAGKSIYFILDELELYEIQLTRTASGFTYKAVLIEKKDIEKVVNMKLEEYNRKYAVASDSFTMLLKGAAIVIGASTGAGTLLSTGGDAIKSLRDHLDKGSQSNQTWYDYKKDSVHGMARQEYKEYTDGHLRKLSEIGNVMDNRRSVIQRLFETLSSRG